MGTTSVLRDDTTLSQMRAKSTSNHQPKGKCFLWPGLKVKPRTGIVSHLILERFTAFLLQTLLGESAIFLRQVSTKQNITKEQLNINETKSHSSSPRKILLAI